jgi:hypothetical protein
LRHADPWPQRRRSRIASNVNFSLPMTQIDQVNNIFKYAQRCSKILSGGYRFSTFWHAPPPASSPNGRPNSHAVGAGVTSARRSRRTAQITYSLRPRSSAATLPQAGDSPGLRRCRRRNTGRRVAASRITPSRRNPGLWRCGGFDTSSNGGANPFSSPRSPAEIIGHRAEPLRPTASLIGTSSACVYRGIRLDYENASITDGRGRANSSNVTVC